MSLGSLWLAFQGVTEGICDEGDIVAGVRAGGRVWEMDLDCSMRCTIVSLVWGVSEVV